MQSVSSILDVLFESWAVKKRKKQQRKSWLGRNFKPRHELLEQRAMMATFQEGNLALLVAGASASNTSGSIVEINTTTAAQTATQTISITGVDYRMSGSATSTGYVALSDDRSLLAFTGHNTTNTTSNVNTLQSSKGVFTVDNGGVVSLATTYTGTGSNQTRGATSLNNTTWFIGDQGGVYTNGAASASPTGNLRAVKSFGGVVYTLQASSTTTTIVVSTVSAASGGTLTGLPGLTNKSDAQDFYLVSSGANGSTYDVLYILRATSNSAGTIEKYSLVSGTWTANGSYTTTFGGFGVAAADVDASNVDDDALIYLSTGQGALTANSVIKLRDTTGYNQTININTGDNVTLYTTATGTIIKGLDFAPTAANQAPVIANNSGTFAEGAIGATITTAMLQATDAEQSAAALTYTVNSVPGQGTIFKSAVALAVNDTFTQADVDNNLITYTHNGSELASDSFTFTVTDGAGGSTPGTFNATITAVNDAPTLTTNAGLTGVVLNATANVTNSILLVSDVDNTAAQIVYTVGTAPTGTLTLTGFGPLAASDTFTQDDINTGKLSYTAPASGTTDSFTFTVSDGAGGSIGSTTFNITLSAGNTNPTLAVNAGLTLAEGATATINTAKLQVTDSEQGAASLTYTVGTAPVNGALKKSGVTLVATDSFTQLDIDNDLITYVHNGGETTSDSFSFTVSDGSGGSIASTSFSITVTAVNDAPVLATNTGLTVLEGAAATVIGSDKLSVTDVDNTAAQIVYTVTTLPTGGTLAKNSVALALNDTFTQDDVNNNLITYAHGGGEVATDNFHFTVSDGAGGSIADTTFAITVTAVNDDPAITVNRTLTLNPGQSVAISNAILLAADPDNTTAQLVYSVTTGPTKGTITKNGVAITSLTQADLNAGDTLSAAIRYTATTAVAGDTDTIVLSLTDGTSTPITVTINVSIVAAASPVSFTGSYSQDFDNLLPTGPVPSDNSSLPAAMILPQGWLASETGTNASNSIRIESGNQSTGDSYFYGSTGSNERALGTQSSGSNDPVRIGVALTNSSGVTITSLNVSYIGEQWRAGNSADEKLSFHYSTDATSLSAGTYTAVTALDFTPPHVDGSGIKDGNNAVNQVNVSGTITGLSWAAGTTIYLRWTDVNSSSTDGANAIDSLSITTANSVPVEATNAGLAIDADATEVITTAMLQYTDAEQGAAALTYTLSSVPASGSLIYDNGVDPTTTLAASSTFTQADINAGFISYTAGSVTTNVSFGFTVSDGAGGTTGAGSFDITVTAAGNAAPTVSVNTGLTLNEGATATIDNAKLAATDDNDSGANLTFTVTATTTNGALKKNGVTLVASDTFTQADIDNSLITYVHSGSETTSDSFTFTVMDSATATTTSQTFSITISPVNDAPVVATNTGASATHGDTITIGSSKLSTTDVDNTAAQIVYTVTAVPTSGTLKKSGVDLIANDTFTQADINSNLITYVAPGSGTSDGFDFSVTDGGSTPLTGTFSITLTGVTQVYINELYLNPQGTDAPNEFIELRGAAGATISSGTYLVAIEGDSTGAGDVQNIFDLSGLTFGSNGLILLLQKGHTYDVSAAITDGTTVVVNSGTGAGWGSGASSSVGHSGDSGATDLENAAASFLVIRSSVAPTLSDDIDDNNDGTPNGSVYSGWTIMDSIGMLDSTAAAGDFGYAALNFAQTGSGAVSTTGPIVTYGGEVEWVGRIGNSTGSTVGDWLAADTTAVTSGQPPFRVSTSSSNVSDAAYRGISINTIGLANNFTLVAPTDIDLSAASVNENVTAGATVGTFTTTDPNVGDTFTYTLVSGTGSTDNAAFTITGDALTINASPNFEAQGSYSIRVRSTDAGGTSFEEVFTITVNNLDEVAPTITSGGTAAAIDENSGAGQVVYTGTSTDTVDYVSGSTTYSLKPATGDGALFSIDGGTGAVTLTGNPDFEAKSSYSFTLVATDAAGNSSEQAVTLAINNLDEVAPTITSGGTAAAIDENSGAGQVVYTVTATDTADISAGVTFSLKPVDDFALFSFNSGTGEVTLTANPDFEAKGSYSFTLVADDGVNTPTEQAVTLAINNLDEVAPTITSGGTATAIDENSGAGQVVYTATSTDTVDYVSGSTTYSLKPATGDVSSFSIVGSTGAVTLLDNPDFEAKSSYSFTVVATDAAGNFSEQAVTLAINDIAVETNAPVVDDQTFNVHLGAINGSTVGTVAATDADAGDTLTYAITAGNALGAFAIDAATGKITVANAGKLPKVAGNVTLTVSVTDDEAVPQSDTATITVSLNGTEAMAPVVSNVATFTVNENNKAVGKVGAVKPKAAYKGQTFSYSLVGVDSAPFAIDAKGNITVTNALALDFETKPTYTFQIDVTDTSGTTGVGAKATIDVTVNVGNLNEKATLAVEDGSGGTVTSADGGKTYVITIDENTVAASNTNVVASDTQNGLLVGNFSASDVDAGSVLTYGLAGGTNVGTVWTDKSGAFQYDSATGDITIVDASKLSYEKTKAFKLGFVVTDNGIPGNTKAAVAKTTVVVALTDKNEAPVILSPSSVDIKENNKADAKVIQVKAKDPDSKHDPKDTVTYSIQSQKDDGAVDVTVFSIDGTTGKITVPVAGALNYEASTFYTLVVRATDNSTGLLYSEQTLTVNVLDLNEAAGFVLTDTTPQVVTELTVSKGSSPIGTVVGTLEVTDQDSGPAGTISVTLADGSKGGFAYNTTTGEITVADPSKLVIGKTYVLAFTDLDSSAKPVKKTVKYNVTINA